MNLLMPIWTHFLPFLFANLKIDGLGQTYANNTVNTPKNIQKPTEKIEEKLMKIDENLISFPDELKLQNIAMLFF